MQLCCFEFSYGKQIRIFGNEYLLNMEKKSHLTKHRWELREARQGSNALTVLGVLFQAVLELPEGTKPEVVHLGAVRLFQSLHHISHRNRQREATETTCTFQQFVYYPLTKSA